MMLLNDTPSIIADDLLNEYISSGNIHPLHSIPLNSASPFSSGAPGLEYTVVVPRSSALNFAHRENGGHKIVGNFSIGRSTRRGPGSPRKNASSTPPMRVTPHEPSGQYLQDMNPSGLLQVPLFANDYNDFMKVITPSATLALDVEPEPRLITPVQQEPALISTDSRSGRYRHGTAGADLDYHAFLKHIMDTPSSASGSIGGFVNDKVQQPVMLCRSPGNVSHRQRRLHACAIKFDGLWIDKDDLYFEASQGKGIINVHPCWWSSSTNPCGMWITGSRARVGAHIRKWHSQAHVASTAKCLWDGCTNNKAMLKDSINRHVVTIHLREGFHCHGCSNGFSRKDLYDKHARNGHCGYAEVTIVYGKEHRVIDINQALREEAQFVM